MSNISTQLKRSLRIFPSANWLLLIGLLVTLLLLSAGTAYASDCPPNNPGDCKSAATTARNPLVPIAGGLLGLAAARALGGLILGAPPPPLPAKDKESEYLDRAVHQMMCGLLQYHQRELMRIRDQRKQVLDEQKMLDDTVRQAQQMVNETRRSWQRAATYRDVGDQLWFPFTLIGTLIWGLQTGLVGRLGAVLSAVGVEFAWAAGGARIPSFPKPESVESAMARIKEVENSIYKWYEEQFKKIEKLNAGLDNEYDRVKGNYDRLRDDIAAYEDKMRKAGMKFKSCLTAGG